MAIGYEEWFRGFAAVKPYDWQKALASSTACSDQLIHVPTGFGKLAGVFGAWAFNRLQRGDDLWPRRLVICLPMRVLVEQTVTNVREWLSRLGWEDVPVHVLMGGVEATRLAEDVDRPGVVVGTQDMLISRALNRGYGMSRAAWPIDFALLHSDALWVFDEVQLMDSSLGTSVQLAAFRRSTPPSRPCRSWWMSATLRADWLRTVDGATWVGQLPVVTLGQAVDPTAASLLTTRKSLERRADVATPDDWALLLANAHAAGTTTLAIVNTVRMAAEVFRALVKRFRATAGGPELRLVHSRFRPFERARWGFLRRSPSMPAGGRIIVATQVVEAGVDMSASLLVTAPAPWSNLVQRFGRCARYAGESGRIIVAGPAPEDARQAAPYSVETTAAALHLVEKLAAERPSASLADLALVESSLGPAECAALQPVELFPVLRRRDFDELFDTSPDLSGTDLDVGRYIRSGEDRDVQIFWRERVESSQATLDEQPAPSRDELCPVPIGEAREWVKEHAVLAFDFLDGVWRRPTRIVPGMTLLVDAQLGGYTPAEGWISSSKAAVPVVPSAASESALSKTASSAEDETLSEGGWKSVATHGREAAAEVARLCGVLGEDAKTHRLLDLAARWHDAGKAHPVFQGAIKSDQRTSAPDHLAQQPLAKAPSSAWRRPQPYPDRPGFRHELASTLALFETMALVAPGHAALTDAIALDAPPMTTLSDPLTAELVSLSADDFDLVAFLVCAHHGKVRCRWTRTPKDQDAGHEGIFGVCDGDTIPSFDLAAASGDVRLPEIILSLGPAAIGLDERYGRSWTDRVEGLRARLGPFRLAWLEALLRIADARASRIASSGVS